LDVDEHTLRNWRSRGMGARRPGRPRHSREEWIAALRPVARAWRSQGRASGWPSVAEALQQGAGHAIPQRIVRGWLWLLKAQHRRYLSRLRESECKHVDVLCRDAVWSQDATHLGRDEHGKVEAVAVKDVATTTLIESAVGGPTCGDDVLALLVRAKLVRGTLPLVLVDDNGPANRRADVLAWLANEQVIVLWNLPHTPQHNAPIERCFGELKGELEADGVLPVRGAAPSQGHVWPSEPGVSRTRERLHESILRTGRRLNEKRLRRSRGWRTAAELDRILPRAEDRVQRDCFYEAACAAIEKAVQDIDDARARRRSEREAVLCTLEEFGLVRRSRGRRPAPARKPEAIT
jgi:transposase InsO family protein